MKRKIIWLVASGLMALALLAAGCYSAPTQERTPTPVTPVPTPAAPTPAPAPPAPVEKTTPTPVTPVPTPAAPTPTTAPTTLEKTTPTSVEIAGFTFVPATITITVGTTITWTNQDSVAHTVSSQGTLFDSGNLSKGATFSYTFSQPGAFEYRCKIHPSMKGKVVVGAEDSGSAIKTGNGTADY